MPKVWFITGCSKGFGWELTQELLTSTDAFVVATARNPKNLKAIEKKYPERLLALTLDITNANDIEQAVQATIKKFKRIDVLINNAGYGLVGALEESTMEEIRAQFETNVFGTIAVIKAVLPHMRTQGSGHMLNISSILGLCTNPGFGLYSATKFAMEGFSESLAGEVEDFGIKVTIVEPGPFRTDFAGNSIQLAATHPDYKNVENTRQYFKSSDGKQPGDPIKAVKILIQTANMEKPPLRLLLGKVALRRARGKIQELNENIEMYEKLSLSADYDV